MFTDSHAHLTHSSVIDHVEAMLQRAKQHKIGTIVNICTDYESLQKGLLLRERHDTVFNAAAVTPHDVEKIGEIFFPEVATCAREGKILAIGETGLDYHYEHSPREMQKRFLDHHLNLAVEADLPLIFHCREAFEDLFERVGKYQAAVLHCFTGTLEEAKKCLDKGWMISFSGIVTFKNSAALREVARFVPLDSILIETDTPYLAPLSKRGKMCEPAYVIETAQVVADVKGVGLEEVAFATSKNADKLFHFPKHTNPV